MVDGIIDRRRIAAIVFEDAEKLSVLNAIVHGAVKDDIAQWVSEQDSDLTFVETAILYESGLNRVVESPLEMRIERTMRRSNLSREEVEKRITSQRIEAPADAPPLRLFIILNDEKNALLPQIEELTGTI